MSVRKLSSNKFCVITPLSNLFENKLSVAFTDEVRSAEEKWGVSLSDGARDTVWQHVSGQVRQRVEDVLKNSWNFHDKSMNVIVHGDYPPLGGTYVELRHVSATDLHVFFARDGYRVANEENSGFHVSELVEHVEGVIVEWLRVATFYAVASYA